MHSFEQSRSPPTRNTVAVAILCKTPSPGTSKTRLSSLMSLADCAEISGCFIADLADTIAALSGEGDIEGFAVYTPAGSEPALRQLLPDAFELVLQAEGDFGVRLLEGIKDLLAEGHVGAILVNSDSPTLPLAILRQAAHAVRKGDRLVLSPAADGGYTLIGLSAVHAELFLGIPWSTSEVLRLTLARAREVGLPVELVDGWYDVDDAESFARLEAELNGAGAQSAPRTSQFVHNWRNRAKGK